MRYLLLGLAVGLSFSATEGSAQTADFKCAKQGTTVFFSDGSKQTWGSEQLQSWGTQQAKYCNLRTEGEPGSKTDRRAWYAPAAFVDAGGPGAYAQQTKIYTIWPLSVGKKVSGRFDGSTPGNLAGGSRPISVLMSIHVERYETISTKAGTFNAFVVLREEEWVASNISYFHREWYAPEVGIVVKRQHQNRNGAVNWITEAVSISKP